MAKKRGLGRGLDALLSGAATAQTGAGTGDGQLSNLPVDLVTRGKYQPRAEIDDEALQALAESIRARGIVQPIVVRPLDDGGRFEIVAGERRWRAAQRAGLQELPALVRILSDEEAAAIGLVENIQREDLNPIDEANGLKRLIEEFGFTHQEIASAVGRSRAAVTNLLRLLTLDENVRALVQRGELDMGHARALLALSGPAQARAAAEVVSRGLSARATEALVRRFGKAGKGPGAAPARPSDPEVQRLQNEISERLGAPVHIRHGVKGKGRVVIHYASLDVLDGILQKLR